MRKHSKADHTENGFTENCKKESTLEKEQPDFIREKIVRKNSIREEILSFGGKPALCGAIFGLTAAFIFAVFLPFFEAFGFGDEKPKETETAQIEPATYALHSPNNKTLQYRRHFSHLSQHYDAWR